MVQELWSMKRNRGTYSWIPFLLHTIPISGTYTLVLTIKRGWSTFKHTQNNEICFFQNTFGLYQKQTSLVPIHPWSPNIFFQTKSVLPVAAGGLAGDCCASHEILDTWDPNMDPLGGANTLAWHPLGSMAPAATASTAPPTFNFGISNVMYYTVYGSSESRKRLKSFRKPLLWLQ